MKLSSSLVYSVRQGIALFVRDFKIRYRRTAFSFLWAVIPSVTASAGAAMAGGHLGVSQAAGPFYLVKVYLGVMLMQTFAESFVAPQMMCVRTRNFLPLVPLKYEALLVAGAGFVGLNFLVRLAVLVPLLVYSGVIPSVLSPLLLLGSALLCLFGLTLGCFLAPMSLVYWDIRYGQAYFVAFAYFATPIFYPLANQGTLGWVNRLNPLTYLVLAPIDWFLHGHSASSGPFFITGAVILGAFSLAVAYFRRALPLGIQHI